MQLTNEDFDSLMEALDIWAKHADVDKSFGMLLYSAMKHKDDTNAAMTEYKEYANGLEMEKLTRQEQAIIIKAKLVYLKRDIVMRRMFDPTELERAKQTAE